MNKKLFFLQLGAVLILVSCGPAAENRELMHARAKIFQDSIANLIKVQMSEAMGPSVMALPRPDQATVAPGASANPQQ